MANLMHADIFFFISSVAIGFFVVCLVVVTIYVVRILRDLRKLSKSVSEEGGKIVEDVDAFRKSMGAEGVKLKALVGVVTSFITSLVPRKITRRKK